MKILILFFLIIRYLIVLKVLPGSLSCISNFLHDTFIQKESYTDSGTEKSEYHYSEPFEILITEIMADPVPSVLLPEAEYLELFNNSKYQVNLSGWQISIGSKSAGLYPYKLTPGEYIILTKEQNATVLQKYGKVMALDKFPALTNAGKTIILRNAENEIIHSVSYSARWYITGYKSEGGWSLEMIDIENPCGNEENWSESVDYKGGTPGKMNSVAGFNPDETRPVLLRAAVLNDSAIQVYFNEQLDSMSLVNNGLYSVDYNLGNPKNIIPVSPHFSSVKLIFNKPLQDDILYTITVHGTIADCAGNILGNNSTAIFAKPELPDSLDMVINEILFNPHGDGEGFVEIFNRSDKTIDIRYFNLATRKPYYSEFKSCYPVTEDHYLFFPGDYILVSSNSENIRQYYQTLNTTCFIEPGIFPAFNNDEGIVILTDSRMNILDEFHYSDDLHFNLLNSSRGVSLERISYDLPTNDPNNWHSASENSGFATPGYINSQYLNFKTCSLKLKTEPEVFSPDNDGYNDYISIIYNFSDPGYVVNITIFDAKGRIVRRLVKNTLPGTSGSFTWNGVNEDNRMSGAGIYLIYAEVFDLTGKVYIFKETCVLAARIN